ncbi:MAG: HAD-IC family P-type ATPase, partial [Christensenellaceae bacterium]
EDLLDADETLTEKLSEYQSRGKRVLILTKCRELITDARPEAAVPIAIIVMKDAIRKEAPETLAFFEREDVDIKVISGDNALTVSRVAEAAGLKNANKYIDVSGLSDDELAEAATRYSVFGRVTPDQKLVLIKALKAKGRTVAMTGDGVNDVLALREADCSIAVASGSDAARNASQIVLLDSNFGSMYNVVMEGRRAINNLERSSVMFIIKTTYSTLLAFLFVFLPGSYPFVPIQLTLITSLIVGFPSFVLAFQPNKNRIRGNFLINILSRALPMGVAAALGVVLVTQIGNLLSLSTEQISTICVLFVAAVTYAALAQACWKPNLLRGILLAVVLVVFVLAVTITGPFFYIEPMTLTMWILLAVLVATLPLLVRVGDVVAKKYALRKLSQAIGEE